MKCRSLPATGCLLLMLAPTAEAIPILDQSAWGFVSPGVGMAITGEQSVAQTFTVGVEGLLARLDLGIWRSTLTTATDVLLDIVPAEGGLRDFDFTGSLASAVINVSAIPVCPDWCQSLPSLSVSLPVPVPVSVGDQLAIVLRRPGGTTYPDWVLWSPASWPESGVPYEGGQSHWHGRVVASIWTALPSNDNRFQTFVSPAQPIPEPASGLLALGGLATLALNRHRARRRSARGCR
ncbi:MAG TPA: hypothetical protein VK911_03280 [Vicinamibacterales bacterium]|nr:hypothetical protein [Vicinamibacterales bacterium]